MTRYKGPPPENPDPNLEPITDVNWRRHDCAPFCPCDPFAEVIVVRFGSSYRHVVQRAADADWTSVVQWTPGRRAERVGARMRAMSGVHDNLGDGPTDRSRVVRVTRRNGDNAIGAPDIFRWTLTGAPDDILYFNTHDNYSVASWTSTGRAAAPDPAPDPQT